MESKIQLTCDNSIDVEKEIMKVQKVKDDEIQLIKSKNIKLKQTIKSLAQSNENMDNTYNSKITDLNSQIDDLKEHIKS